MDFDFINLSILVIELIFFLIEFLISLLLNLLFLCCSFFVLTESCNKIDLIFDLVDNLFGNDDVCDLESKINDVYKITKTIDLSGLADGFYNIELVGEDAGGNVTRVSRNVQLSKESDGAKIDILTPLNGEYLQGMFNLYGTEGNAQMAVVPKDFIKNNYREYTEDESFLVGPTKKTKKILKEISG